MAHVIKYAGSIQFIQAVAKLSRSLFSELPHGLLVGVGQLTELGVFECDQH